MCGWTCIDPNVGRHPDILLLTDPPDRVVVVAVVVRDVELPQWLSCYSVVSSMAVDPPHWLVELVDDDGDAAQAGKRHDRVISSVGAQIT